MRFSANHKILILFLLITCLCIVAFAEETRSMDVEPSGAEMLIRGNTLYLAVSVPQAMLYVFDISDAQAPRKTAEIPMSGFPHSLAAEKSSLYAVDTENLYVFDLMNPNRPVLKKKDKIADAPFGPVETAVQNDHIFLANLAGGVIRDASPLRDVHARTLCVSANGRIFAAGAHYIVSLEDDPAKRLEIKLDSGTPFQLRANGNDLYLTLGFHGLTVFREAALIQTKWNWIDRKIIINSGKFLPVAQNRENSKESESVQLITGSTGMLGKYAVPGTFVYDVAFDTVPAHYVFLAAGESGVITVDASKPDTLTAAAACQPLTGHKIRGIAGQGRIFYVYDAGTFRGKYAASSYGIHIIDTSDPLKLKIIGDGIQLSERKN